MNTKNYSSKGKARALLYLLLDPAVIVDEIGNFLKSNGAFKEVTGINRKELIGNPFFKHSTATTESKAVLSEKLKKRLQDAPAESYDLISPVLPVKQTFVELKGKERESQSEVEEISSIIDGIGDMLFVMDAERHLIMVNKSACEVFKKKPEELLGKHCYEIVHGTDKPWPNCPAEKMFETRQTVSEEVNDPNMGVPLLVTTSPILDKRGEIIKCIHIAKDISKIKLAEMEMHIAANLFDAASDSIIMHELEGRIVYFNDAAHKITGYTKDEFQELSVQDLGPGYQRFFASQMRQLLDNGEATFEAAHLCKDNTVMPVEIHAQVIEFDGRKLVLSIARDITERKRIEDALRQSEEKFRSIIENSSDQIFMLDRNCRFLSINKTASDLFGMSPHEMVGKSISEMFPETIAAQFSKNIKNAFDTGESMSIEEKMVVKGGEFYGSPSLNPVRDDSGRVVAVAGIVRNITERKKAEQSLVESEEKFRILAEESPNMIFINQMGKVIYANKKVEETSGYTIEEICSPDFNFFGLFSPEYVETLKLNHAKQMRGESLPPFEQVLVTRAGKRINVIVTTKRIVYNGKQALLGILTDISEHIEFEEKLKESYSKIELMNEKLRVVGRLTRHDVRNKLATVNGYAYLLKKKHSDEVEILDKVNKIEQAVQETVRIFDFAKMYEQIGAEELTYINVEEKLREAVALFSGPIPTIMNECHGLTVLADSFLRQLFYNFIDNTRKYGKKTTTIRVSFETAESGDLRLIYEDDGEGISAENKVNLFKEGFSTGGSTGFGLFLIKKMMDVYGWEIQENGEPDKGAKFIITIPKLGKNGKENFQIAKNHESDRKLEHDKLPVHFPNSEDKYSFPNNSNVVPVLLKERGGDDVAD